MKAIIIPLERESIMILRKCFVDIMICSWIQFMLKLEIPCKVHERLYIYEKYLQSFPLG